MTSNFTAHNILLPDGSLTMPDCGWTIAESPWFLSAKRILELVYPGGMSEKRILDLGCLEGGYTVEFARMGFDAVGVEVRESNFSNCEYVRKKLKLNNLSFIKDDVWNIEKLGTANAIFCCGLLYHLDRPRAFIELMGRIASDVVIINTHYASDHSPEKFKLGEMSEHEGLSGRWYAEHDTDNIEELETYKWTSWVNKKSFWLTKESILHALHKAGFDLVFEQYDWLGDNIIEAVTKGYYKSDNRSQFVGIRSKSQTSHPKGFPWKFLARHRFMKRGGS